MAAAAALLQSPHARSLPVRHTVALERLCELYQTGLWFAELGALADLLLAASCHPLRLELQVLLCQLIRRAAPSSGRAVAFLVQHYLHFVTLLPVGGFFLLSYVSLTYSHKTSS